MWEVIVMVPFKALSSMEPRNELRTSDTFTAESLLPVKVIPLSLY